MSEVRKNDVSTMLIKVNTATSQTFAKKTLVLEGKPWTVGDITQAFQGQIAALHASDAAHAAWLKTVTDQRSQYKTVIVPLLKALRAYVALLYGTGSQTYLDFGFAPPKKAKPSITTQSAAMQQRLATRVARNTMGKRQRLAIKGVVQPVTAAPAATSPAQPGTSAAASTGQPNGSAK
jgi:hypothetical protein